jgi:hypothetical protein
MGQHQIVVDVEHCQLMQHAVFALAQRGDPASYRGHALTDVGVESLDKGGIDGIDNLTVPVQPQQSVTYSFDPSSSS